jgi:hypothetical protein
MVGNKETLVDKTHLVYKTRSLTNREAGHKKHVFKSPTQVIVQMAVSALTVICTKCSKRIECNGHDDIQFVSLIRLYHDRP